MRLVDADELKKSGYRLVHIDNLTTKIERRSWVDVPTAYDVEKAEKERKALQNRCRIFTNGVLCMDCPMECENRTMPFFGKKVE